MERGKVKELMEKAQLYAEDKSGCNKVAVGSVLLASVDSLEFAIYGANCTLPQSCREVGCLRKSLYGEDSKNHRLPSDCRAIHSEIDVITQAAKRGISTNGATIIVTRYPCEACARAIVGAGIAKVYYGRNKEISEETKKIFEAGHVKVEWIKDFVWCDTDR